MLNLVKQLVYAETSEDFAIHVEEMVENETYRKYENFKRHVEQNILPRHREWFLKERYENKSSTRSQNTTNYVEYSFRMTKDVQFLILKHLI